MILKQTCDTSVSWVMSFAWYFLNHVCDMSDGLSKLHHMTRKIMTWHVNLTSFFSPTPSTFPTHAEFHERTKYFFSRDNIREIVKGRVHTWKQWSIILTSPKKCALVKLNCTWIMTLIVSSWQKNRWIIRTSATFSLCHDPTDPMAKGTSWLLILYLYQNVQRDMRFMRLLVSLSHVKAPFKID